MANEFPHPSKTPNTPVPAPGGQIVGYPPTIKTFVGCGLISVDTKAWQNQPFRTLTAYRLRIDEAHDLAAAMLGSTVHVFRLSRLFARMEANEPLAEVSRPDGKGERYLNPDNGRFYAETAAGWEAPITDGQNRLPGLALDGRGNIVVAYMPFGWGILRTTGGGVTSAFQIPPNDATGDPQAFNVLPFS